MNDIKIYDSTSLPKGDFFHKQWNGGRKVPAFKNPTIVFDGEVIPSGIEDLELVAPDDVNQGSTPRLDEEHSFTIKLSEEESDKISKMFWLDKMEWLTRQMNTVWKDKFYIEDEIKLLENGK